MESCSAQIAGTVMPPVVAVRRLLLRLVVALLIPYGPMVAWHCGPLLGLWGWRTVGAELFLVVPVMGGIALVGLVPLIAVPRTRTWARRAVLVCVVLVVGFLPAAMVSHRLRMRGFELAGVRAAPVVAAIEGYVAANGHPPATLSDLVPRWLVALPEGLPPLELEVGSDLWGNPWILRALVPIGVLNFDEFFYFPNQAYPAVGHGGSWQRLGRWAYLHE